MWILDILTLFTVNQLELNAFLYLFIDKNCFQEMASMVENVPKSILAGLRPVPHWESLQTHSWWEGGSLPVSKNTQPYFGLSGLAVDTRNTTRK